MVSLVIFIILIFGILMGLRRGFILQLLHLFGFIISFIIASVYYKDIAGRLSLWIPYPDLASDSSWALFLNSMPLENAFYNAVSFVIIFAGVKIILQIVATMLDFVAKFPVLRSVNKWLGALLGFIEVYIILFILLFLVALVPVEVVQAKIDSSFLAKFIVDHTPILSNTLKSLFFTDSLS